MVLAILAAICDKLSKISGLLLVPEVRTILSAALLAEIAIILAVLGKSRFVLSVSSVYQGIVLAQTLIYGAVIGTEIVETIKTLPNRLLINASPDSINRLVTVNLWFIIVVYLLVILFTYLHFTSLIATIQRIDDEINSSQDNSLPLYATLEPNAEENLKLCFKIH